MARTILRARRTADNETDGDFAMKNFSIAHDKDTLVPFIQAAKKYQPALKLWASPWSPPTWMKHNHFYAEAKAYPGFKDNGIKPEQIGHEGEDMFIQEPRYFEAYALYFQKFIEAYRAEGIRMGIGDPQERIQLGADFPSCTWTAAGLAHFIESVGPAMEKIGVDVFFGTLERGNIKLLDATMDDKKASRYIKGVGVQWAGKNALAEIDSRVSAPDDFSVRAGVRASGRTRGAYTSVLLAADEGIFPARRKSVFLLESGDGEGRDDREVSHKIRWSVSTRARRRFTTTTTTT